MVRESSDDEPFAALAFKIMTDPFVGTLTFTRIYSGVLEKGTSVLNSVKGKRERIGRMLEMNANDRTDIEQARAGDIIAIVGCKDTTTGETLCDPEQPVILEKMDFPEPVIKVSVEPKTKADQDKMTQALIKLAAEDPSFRFSRDEESGQTTIEGMGELHLEIICDRMMREFKVECQIGAPQVAYREAISKPATVEYTHKKQSGGSGQFAKIVVKFEPLDAEDEDNTGFIFDQEIKGGTVPKEYIPGVAKGLESIMGNGVLAGFPVIGCKATLMDGAFHDVDSSVMAFEIAGRQCARKGLKEAGAKLMEPMMKVEVTTPEEYMGDVIGDINSRRGMVAELAERGNMKVVRAQRAARQHVPVRVGAALGDQGPRTSHTARRLLHRPEHFKPHRLALYTNRDLHHSSRPASRSCWTCRSTAASRRWSCGSRRARRPSGSSSAPSATSSASSHTTSGGRRL